MRIICAITITLAAIGPLPCSAAATVILPDPAQPMAPPAAAPPAKPQPADTGYRPGTISFYGIPAPVPETTLWALLVGGFALVGAKLRRRSNRSGV
jgi:hypothetical protein